MTQEQILVELLSDYYTLKEAYKTKQEELKKITAWWTDAFTQRDELSKEVAELTNKSKIK